MDYCEACGSQFVDGKHPAQQCEPREWAAYQNRLLRSIVDSIPESRKPEEKPAPEELPASE